MHTNPDILALLALGEKVGTLSEREHAGSCPECAEELAELTRLAGIARSGSSSDVPFEPSPQVWERIRTELGFPEGDAADPSKLVNEPTTSVPVSDTSTARPARAWADRRGQQHTRARQAVTLAVAAVLVLVVGVGAGIGYDRISQPKQRVIAQAQLNALPKWLGSSGSATIVVDRKGNRKLVLRMTTSREVIGRREVWLIDTRVKDMHSLGPLTGAETTLPVPPEVSLFKFPIVDVSDEPPNDPSPAHSGNSIVRGQLG